VQLFELILDWASTALHNAALYGQLTALQPPASSPPSLVS